MLFDLVYESVEKVTAVVRAGTGLRMELNREDRLAFQSDARHRTVIQVLMGHHDSSTISEGTAADHESVVLGSDFTFATLEVLYRVVDPAVALEHLFSLQALTQCDQLMAQADAEDRLSQVNDVLDQRNGIRHG